MKTKPKITNPFSLSDVAFTWWLETRFAIDEAVKGAKYYCDATAESYEKVRLFMMELDPQNKSTLLQLMTIGWTMNHLEVNDVNIVLNAMHVYEDRATETIRVINVFRDGNNPIFRKNSRKP